MWGKRGPETKRPALEPGKKIGEEFSVHCIPLVDALKNKRRKV